MKIEELLPILQREMEIMKCVKDIALATPDMLVQDKVRQITRISQENLKYIKSLEKSKQ